MDFRKYADSANAENYIISLFVSAFNFAMEFFMAVSKPFVTTTTLWMYSFLENNYKFYIFSKHFIITLG